MDELVRAQAFRGVMEGRARWPAFLDTVELRRDELLGIDWVFCDCLPEGLGEMVEVIECLSREFPDDELWKKAGH
ncbi:hypothetical protein D3C76_1784280 [compost metagenome]